MADELAEQGTTLEILPDKETLGIPLSTYQLLHRTKAMTYKRIVNQ